MRGERLEVRGEAMAMTGRWRTGRGERLMVREVRVERSEVRG